jgi:hypothetical protein
MEKGLRSQWRLPTGGHGPFPQPAAAPLIVSDMDLPTPWQTKLRGEGTPV